MIFRKVDDLRETFVKDTQRLRDLFFGQSVDHRGATKNLFNKMFFN